MNCAHTRLFVLFLGAALALPAAAGQLYKWTDANGRVQYSDTPPPDRKVEQLKSRIGTSTSPAPAAEGAENKKAAPQSIADQEQAFRKRRAEAEENQEKLAKEEADKKNKAENCDRTKRYLASLEQGGRHSSLNAKGEREYFDDAKMASEKESARKQIEEMCK